MGSDGFTFRASYLSAFGTLDDARFMRLIRLACEYAKSGDMPSIDDQQLDLCFRVIKSDIDEHNKMLYEAWRKKSMAGKKGMKKRWGLLKNIDKHNKHNSVINTSSKSTDNEVVNNTDNNVINERDNKHNSVINIISKASENQQVNNTANNVINEIGRHNSVINNSIETIENQQVNNTNNNVITEEDDFDVYFGKENEKRNEKEKSPLTTPIKEKENKKEKEGCQKVPFIESYPKISDDGKTGSENFLTNPKPGKGNCKYVDAVMSHYNERMRNKPMPKIKKVTPQRKAAVMNRISEYSYQDVIRAIDNAAESNFLNGDNKHCFIASFDWIMRPNNFPKVLEGNYDNKTPKAASPKDLECGFQLRPLDDYEVKFFERVKKIEDERRRREQEEGS